MTAFTIALVQVLYLVILYLPMGWHRLGLPRGIRIGVGYLASNALALFIGYYLDMMGWFSVQRMFTIWLLVCVGLNILIWPTVQHHLRCRLGGAKKYVYALLAGVLALTLWIRLADPMMNVALAGADCYRFVNFYYWIQAWHRSIHDYPSGFALLTSMAPWPMSPYESVRWAPHFVFIACQAAAFGFWRRIGGTRFALALTLLLGTAWFLYPITAYYPHFIQWTTSFIGIPAMLLIYARLTRRISIPLILAGLLINFVFVMTSAYFALYMNVLLLLLTTCALPKNRTALKPLAAATGVALVAPLTLLIFFGILARFFFSNWTTVGVTPQLDAVIACSNMETATHVLPGPAGSTSILSHPLVQVVFTFLSPTLPLHIGPRWLAYAGLFALGLWVWRAAKSNRDRALRLLSGVLLFSVFSAMTGIFELPAWEGRNVFISLYTGLALAVWTAIRCCPRLTHQAFHHLWVVVLIAAAVAGPALFWPPMIGYNVPVAETIGPRSIPADNQVLTELTRNDDLKTRRKTLALIVSQNPPAPLLYNLSGLHWSARKNVFPNYRIKKVHTLAPIISYDALLISDSVFSAYPLSDNYIIHTRGLHYVFAIRKQTNAPLASAPEQTGNTHPPPNLD